MENKIIEELKGAIMTEAMGHVFYKHASELIEDKRGKNVFNHLADEELEHMEVITAIADTVSGSDKWPRYGDALRAGSSKGAPIFPEENELVERLKANPTEENAIKIAMESEDKAISFYLGLLKRATTPEEKVVLTRLLEMEKAHLKLLRWEKESLEGSGFWCDMMEYSVEKELT